MGLAFLLLAPDGTRLEAWAMFTGAGLSVLLLNALYRLGVSGDAQRDREQDAGEYFEEHGEWPEEEESTPGTESSGRRWRLPEGAVTPEWEEEQALRSRAEGRTP